MPATNSGILTQGTRTFIATDATTYQELFGITAFTGLGSGEQAEIDITTFNSASAQKALGLKDNGTATLNLTLDFDEWQTYKDLVELGNRQILMVFPNGSFESSYYSGTPTVAGGVFSAITSHNTVRFTGTLKEPAVDMNTNDVARFTAGIVVNSAVVPTSKAV
jgi:hypothetical protein